MNPVNNFFLNFNIQLKMSFKNACKNNDIELAKTCKMPDKNTFDKLFSDNCADGYLESAQLLHSRGKTDLAKYNDKFIRTCINGRLDDAKWLYSICVDISYKNNCAILFACQNGYLDMAKWLYSVGAEITEPDNEPFLATCLGDAVNVIEWLIDIHYKYGGYIEFEQYGLYKDKIKNVLIDNNLVNPSTLSREDLTYYLARTDNFVPPDFTTQHEGFTVKYRGKHTKPAYRE